MAPRDQGGVAEGAGNESRRSRRRACASISTSSPAICRTTGGTRRRTDGTSPLSAACPSYPDYTADCREKGKTPVKEALYRQIFNRDFNINFRLPLQDTCHVCDRAAQTGCTAESELHKSRAAAKRAAFKADKAACRLQSTKLTCCADNKPSAGLATSAYFYRQGILFPSAQDLQLWHSLVQWRFCCNVYLSQIWRQSWSWRDRFLRAEGGAK